jgi:hypothetical protein
MDLDAPSREHVKVAVRARTYAARVRSALGFKAVKHEPRFDATGRGDAGRARFDPNDGAA